MRSVLRKPILIYSRIVCNLTMISYTIINQSKDVKLYIYLIAKILSPEIQYLPRVHNALHDNKNILLSSLYKNIGF